VVLAFRRTAPSLAGEGPRGCHFKVAGIPQAFAPLGMSRFTNDITPITTPSPIATPFSMTLGGPI
jgi:hypothetical protein